MMEEKTCQHTGCAHTETVSALWEDMPDTAEFASLSTFFKVFGDPTRLKILWALGAGEMCVCDVAELLGMTKSAVSHQLGYLRQNRLVSFRREGKSVVYQLSDAHIKTILETGLEHINE